MRAIAKKQLNLWPVFIKSPSSDISSFALNPMINNSLDKFKVDFKVDKVIELSNYSHCPLTKVYLNHQSYNTGLETHFFIYQGEVVGSMVIQIALDQISNWKADIIRSRVVELFKKSLLPLEIIRHSDPFLFNDNYSIKSGFSLHMEVEGEDFSLFAVNVYLDLSHEVASILMKHK